MDANANQTQTPMANVVIVDNRYGQPITAPPSLLVPNAVVVNQQAPVAMVNPEIFKTDPLSITCQNCKQNITTLVNKKFNIVTCLLCFCTGIIFYVCVQCIRGKDICCFDAEHNCPRCGSVVGTYTSC